MHKRFLFVILLLVMLILPAVTAFAQEGFYLGLFVPTETIGGSAGGGISSGTGWGTRFGYSFSRYFSVEANYTSSNHDASFVMLRTNTADLKGLAGDIKLSFPLTSLDSAQIMTVMPYLMLGYAHYELDSTATYKSDGAQWGIGVELYLFKELSVQVGLTKTNITFKNGTVPFVENDGNIKRVDLGLTYHFR